jgi:uncharacterized glyoxalase superfamily protein PhnB
MLRGVSPGSDLSNVIPVLPARNVADAIRFYVDKLGFQVAFQDPVIDPQYAGVRRGPAMLHLQFHFEEEVAKGTAGQCVLRLVVDDLDALYWEYADKGVFHAGTELRDTEWGTREFAFWDLDHNGLTFMCGL